MTKFNCNEIKNINFNSITCKKIIYKNNIKSKKKDETITLQDITIYPANKKIKVTICKYI